jgi:tetratricopeptide (TPR) repeat protein
VDVTDRVRELGAALTLLESDQHDNARRICEQLVARDRHDIEARLLLGLAIGFGGDADAAAPVLNGVARERSRHAHPCRDLAQMLLGQGMASLIAPQYRACLRLTPHDMRLCFAFAEFLRENGDALAAVALLEPLLRSHLDSAEMHDQMGLSLAEAGQFAEAAEQFRQAIAYDPGPAVFWANLGMMLKVENRFDEALDVYAEALVRSPDNTQIRVNRAVTRLHAGRFAEAWQDRAWVLTQPGGSALPAGLRLPPLSQLPDLTGQTVLVVQEEGLGDTLQFLRYLPLLARRGARVAVAVPPALTRLMRTIPGVAEVPGGDAPIPRHDFHCSFNGLPRAFETTLESIPCDVPYLSADPNLAADWARRLPVTRALRVGLVWAGQARPWLPGFTGLDQRRSTSLATLAPLGAVAGVQFVSLQKGEAAAEMPPFDMIDVMDDVRDFADTAAIVANLDLVISVDTSVVHLAGAMGKPVFLLDRYDNCWRWLSGREDSPWYPSLRIFRQQRSGEWGPVIERVTAALGDAVSTCHCEERSDEAIPVNVPTDQVIAASLRSSQ